MLVRSSGLAVYSVDPSSIPAEVYSFNSLHCLKMTKMADLNKFVQFRVKAPLLLGGHHDVPRRTGRYFGISQINAKSTATVLLVPPWFVKINTKIFLSYLLFELFKAENVDEDWMRGYMQQILLHSSYAYNYSSRIMKLYTYILLSCATASIRSFWGESNSIL